MDDKEPEQVETTETAELFTTALKELLETKPSVNIENYINLFLLL